MELNTEELSSLQDEKLHDQELLINSEPCQIPKEYELMQLQHLMEQEFAKWSTLEQADNRKEDDLLEQLKEGPAYKATGGSSKKDTLVKLLGLITTPEIAGKESFFFQNNNDESHEVDVHYILINKMKKKLVG